ncbi:MAG: PhzF family phenazine biosynthesis protein [Acidimicrobiia bacterium]|nr:PhzF family phenazine biosynthesis protein [Acidimicrobiia bacterium]
MSRTCHVVRVFTRGATGGNHLGVVIRSEGLGTLDMQAIATELGFSETIFLIPGDPPAVRIFTPGREMPFAGHPLVGMTWILRELDVQQTDRLLCGIGLVRVGFDGPDAWIEAPPDRPVRAAPGADQVAATLGLVAPISAAWVDMPISYLVLELESPEAVADVSFTEDAMAATGVGELYLYAWANGDRAKSRFFAPEAGVFEDPATGSAAVALASKLANEGRSSGTILIDQGDEIGHPSTIGLNWSPDRVRIGGGVSMEEVRLLDELDRQPHRPHTD